MVADWDPTESRAAEFLEAEANEKITQPASFSSPLPCPCYLQITYDTKNQIWPMD